MFAHCPVKQATKSATLRLAFDRRVDNLRVVGESLQKRAPPETPGRGGGATVWT